MKFKQLIIFIFFFTATPAIAEEIYAVTPSQTTEAYFVINITETSDLLANSCVDLGWSVLSSTDTAVVCELPVSFGSRLLSSLSSPKYATPPRDFIRFNLAGANGLTRAQASSWREIQTAFGQNQRNDLESKDYHNSIMNFFLSIGGIYPPGTAFTNHAFAGISTSVVVDSPRDGVLITLLEMNGPFIAAGLLNGDLITRVARKRVKNHDDLLSGLSKAVENQSYTVEFYRDGNKMEVEVSRQFRQTVGPLPKPAPKEDPVESTSKTIVQNEISIAEELAKFAKLRDEGVLTEEEFEAQKSKLLSR